MSEAAPKPTPVPAAAPKPPAGVRSTSTLEPSTSVSISYQGPPETGKTHNAFSWPGAFGLYFDTGQGTLRKYPKVPFVTPAKWDELEQTWLPAIQNRRLTELVRRIAGFENYTVRTIVADSVSFLTEMLKFELGGENGEKALGYDGWGLFGARMRRFLLTCASATKPLARRPDAECYNFVATIHESEQTTETGAVLKVNPRIQGATQSIYNGFFDAVFLTYSTVEKVGGVERKSYWCRAIDDLSAKRSGRDQLSSPDFGQLPAKFVGTYPNICKYWRLADFNPQQVPDRVPETASEDNNNKDTK